MSKKVLILSSSPRKGGNSDVLCDVFLKGASESGNEVEKIFLKEKKIDCCSGCGFCSEHGAKSVCSQKDDMAEIFKKLIEADVIVMATPVYFYTMCAQMKTLIDRCCAGYTEIRNKEFYFIVTAADTEIANMKPTIEGFRAFTSCLDGAVERKIIYGVGAWKIGDINKTKALAEAYETGKRV